MSFFPHRCVRTHTLVPLHRPSLPMVIPIHIPLQLYTISALLISDGNNDHGGLYGYAFSCGLISLAVVAVIMFLQVTQP